MEEKINVMSGNLVTELVLCNHNAMTRTLTSHSTFTTIVKPMEKIFCALHQLGYSQTHVPY